MKCTYSQVLDLPQSATPPDLLPPIAATYSRATLARPHRHEFCSDMASIASFHSVKRR
eukprot:COSAG01_NODE_44612_length_417_cov_1.015723_1_plen_57_part_01